MIASEKALLRKTIRKTLKGVTEYQRLHESEAVAKRIIACEELIHKKKWSVFLSLDSEISTRPILEFLFSTGRHDIYVPKVFGSNPEDMKMIKVNSLFEIDAFPKVKTSTAKI
jgi:5-formyltetrahydrofolate cyclo-ligase